MRVRVCESMVFRAREREREREFVKAFYVCIWRERLYARCVRLKALIGPLLRVARLV